MIRGKVEFFLTDEFKAALRKHAGIKKQVLRKMEQILSNPYHNSELLQKKKVDLRGKRSRRITRNFRIVFMICEECVTRGFRAKGFNECAFCTSLDPQENYVVFMTVGPHERAYGEK